MGSATLFYEPYRAAVNEDWESLKDFYKENVGLLFFPVTASRGNAFHLAVFSGSNEPLQSLLDFNISERDFMMTDGYLQPNVYGNTPLHEAAAIGNLKAVEALVNHHRKLFPEENIEDQNENEFLEAVNMKGETALFVAAAFGRTKVVKFLASKSLETKTRFIYQKEERKEEQYTKLKDIHYKNLGLIHVKPESDASNQLTSTIQGEIISEPIPDTSNQLSGTIRGEILKPKPGATQKETFKEVPGFSILHVAITGHHFETALYLLKKDESLATLKDLNGLTSFHLLATMPSAFESRYRWGTWIHRVAYICLPIGDETDDDVKATTKISRGWLLLLGKICALVRRNIFEEKRKHKFALKLVEGLIEKDSSWDETMNEQVAPAFQFDEDQSINVDIPVSGDYKPIPLLLATESGIVEIVTRILEVRPQLVEHKNDLDQNILHVAIKHRQYDIFDHVKNMKIPMTWLVRKVDKNGYTILHHAADMEPETTKTHPAGPVYQLQQEIKWYKLVEEIMPAHYARLRDKKQNKTCEELFKMKHNELHKQAHQWIKDTSQSCPAVAVLVAGVVFAAAYTVPGGSNEKGHSGFLYSTLFLVFTVMDAVALTCSLTSIVMFLSFPTSSYTYEEFHQTLPNKLSIGFALLFISLTTTMIAFAATLLLIARSEKPHWTTTIIYTAALFPVSIFTLSQFPICAAFGETLLKLYRRLSKILHLTKPRRCRVAWERGQLSRPPV
ncbi:ankyrin repeat-containing protein ITN1-like [Mangifera indica]|uniref:ankyrin repeat-containing protein ITN1-like n=1 Tax=Mangifera indica TaxID=29780 RepID=UPI001CF96116|nr:ankyrin repeat-containing protein ITN1-like [Mangifera indica]